MRVLLWDISRIVHLFVRFFGNLLWRFFSLLDLRVFWKAAPENFVNLIVLMYLATVVFFFGLSKTNVAITPQMWFATEFPDNVN